MPGITDNMVCVSKCQLANSEALPLKSWLCLVENVPDLTQARNPPDILLCPLMPAFTPPYLSQKFPPSRSKYRAKFSTVEIPNVPRI